MTSDPSPPSSVSLGYLIAKHLRGAREFHSLGVETLIMSAVLPRGRPREIQVCQEQPGPAGSCKDMAHSGGGLESEAGIASRALLCSCPVL
ncbi:hypothetical protein P7K49_032801 [Saguinus oedipus]|uniref:Uncharacterized protein n=1 Tax=Saguinus oedipus TaxID=9490 RepID=A0ABQ9TQ36_SAGOE|nr:hypothetical protein P7K49_032801 [Saguinus oedipus]